MLYLPWLWKSPDGYKNEPGDPWSVLRCDPVRKFFTRCSRPPHFSIRRQPGRPAARRRGRGAIDRPHEEAVHGNTGREEILRCVPGFARKLRKRQGGDHITADPGKRRRAGRGDLLGGAARHGVLHATVHDPVPAGEDPPAIPRPT